VALALELLRDAALGVVIKEESDFEALQETQARLASTPGDVLCHRVRYPQAVKTGLDAHTNTGER